MRKVAWIVLLFTIIGSTGASGQNRPNISAKDLLTTALYCYQEENWPKAIRTLKNIIDNYNEDPLVEPRLEELSMKLMFAEFARDFQPTAEFWDDIFAGNVISYIPQARVIEIEYTFKDKKELNDFYFGRITNNGLRSGQANTRYLNMNKYSAYCTLKIPLQVPWQVNMTVREQGNVDRKLTAETPRGGVYLRFGDMNGKNGYIYGIDVNYHDGRMKAPHGMLKYHPGGRHQWDFMASDFSPRLIPFQEMDVKVVCHSSGSMGVMLDKKMLLKAQDDDYKRGFLHFGPGNVFFKTIRVKGRLDESYAEVLLNEMRERAWAERLERFRAENGMIPPGHAFDFPVLPDKEAKNLMEYSPPDPDEEEQDKNLLPLKEAPGDEPFSFGMSGILFQGMDAWGIPAEENESEPVEETEPALPDAAAEILEEVTEKEAQEAAPPEDGQTTPAVTGVESPLYLTYAAGVTLRLQGKYPEALEKFNEVLTYNETSVPAIYERSYCRYALKNYTKALEDIALLEEWGFMGEGLAFLRARIMLLQDDPAGIADLALIQPESAYYPFSRMVAGWFHYLREEFEEADAAFAEAIEMDEGLKGSVAWYRDRIEAFQNGPKWIDASSFEGRTCRVFTGASRKTAAAAGKIADSFYGDCDRQFSFLKVSEDKGSKRKLKPVDIYCFATESGLLQYLDRIVIGRHKLQDQTAVVYDERYNRVYLHTDFQGQRYKETFATVAVMTYLRNLHVDFPAWFENGLSFYFENSLIENTSKGIFNLSSSKVETRLFSTNKFTNLHTYYLHLTDLFGFPINYTHKHKTYTAHAVVPARIEKPEPGEFKGMTALFDMDSAGFNTNLIDNKTEAGLFVYFLFKYRKGFYRNFLSTYFRGMLEGKSSADIFEDDFPPGYTDRLLQLKDWYVLNLWQEQICGGRAVPQKALYGSPIKE